MTANRWKLAAGLAVPLAAGCTTPQEEGSAEAGGEMSEGASAPADSGTTDTTDTTDTTTPTDTGTSTGTGGIPALVNVNLENVLNDLSVRLQIDRANIPVNAQIPIDVAANVCGVSVNVLSVSTGGQASCTAQTASDELAQVVQQQMAAGGSVGGGAQGGSTATTGTATGTGGSSTSGSTDTSATSTGTTETTNTQLPPDEPQ